MSEMGGVLRGKENGGSSANLYDTLKATAGRFPDKQAAVDNHGSVTYKELRERVDMLALFLQTSLHATPGDTIAILQANSIDFCASFYAIVKLGCVTQIINSKLQPFEIETLLRVTSPAILLLDSEWWTKIAPVLGSTSLAHLVFTCDKRSADAVIAEYPCTGPLPACYMLPEIYAAGMPKTFPECRVGGDAPAILLFTSGSTGNPKGVRLTHRNIIESIRSYAEGLKLGPNEVTVLSVPAFHVTGLICVMALFVAIGGKIVYMPRFDAKETIRNIERHKATHFHAVATVYLLLEAALRESGGENDLSCLHMAVCGGGAISEVTMKSIKSYIPGLDFRPVYGLTETSGAGVAFPCDYFAGGKSGSAGKVVPGCHMFICDSDGNELPIGEVGEICVKGGIVTPGYFGQGDLPGGILHTGDVGRMDEDGFVYIMDRIKDLINRGGEKIYCLEVESLLVGMDEVRQAALFGIPDSLYGEIPVAALVLEPEAELCEDAVISYLKDRIAKYKLPTRVLFLTELPASANGKVLKNKLREQFSKTEE